MMLKVTFLLCPVDLCESDKVTIIWLSGEELSCTLEKKRVTRASVIYREYSVTYMTVKLWTDTVTVSDKHAILRTILKPEAATSGKLHNEPSWWIRRPRRLIPCTSAQSLCHIASTHRY